MISVGLLGSEVKTGKLYLKYNLSHTEYVCVHGIPSTCMGIYSIYIHKEYVFAFWLVHSSQVLLKMGGKLKTEYY